MKLVQLIFLGTIKSALTFAISDRPEWVPYQTEGHQFQDNWPFSRGEGTNYSANVIIYEIDHSFWRIVSCKNNMLHNEWGSQFYHFFYLFVDYLVGGVHQLGLSTLSQIELVQVEHNKFLFTNTYNPMWKEFRYILWIRKNI